MFINREKAIAYVEEQYRLFKNDEDKQAIVEGCVEALKFTPIANVVEINNESASITKDIWKEISCVLKKYKIPYTTNFKKRDVQRAIEYPDMVIIDKCIQINLIIPDYFKEMDK